MALLHVGSDPTAGWSRLVLVVKTAFQRSRRRRARPLGFMVVKPRLGTGTL